MFFHVFWYWVVVYLKCIIKGILKFPVYTVIVHTQSVGTIRVKYFGSK